MTTKKIVADVPLELHQQIKARAAMLNKSMDQFIREAVIIQLERDNPIPSGNTQIDPSLYKRYVERKEAEKGELA